MIIPRHNLGHFVGAPNSCDPSDGNVASSGSTDLQIVVPPEVERPVQRTFSLASMFMLITLIGILLGIFRVYPTLSIVASILGLPALWRTSGIVWRRRQRSRDTSLSQRIDLFLASYCVVIGICLFGGMLFTVFSMAGGVIAGVLLMVLEMVLHIVGGGRIVARTVDNAAAIVSLMIGALGSLAAVYWLFGELWWPDELRSMPPRSARRPDPPPAPP